MVKIKDRLRVVYRTGIDVCLRERLAKWDDKTIAVRAALASDSAGPCIGMFSHTGQRQTRSLVAMLGIPCLASSTCWLSSAAQIEAMLWALGAEAGLLHL